MMMIRKWLWALACAAVMTGAGPVLADAAKPATTLPAPPKTAQEGMKNVAGQDILKLSCVACHGDVKGVAAKPDHYHGSCESCHSGGDVHRQSLVKGETGKGSIAFPKSAECTSCHKNDRKLMHWAFSEHNKAGGVCSDCHTVHGSPVGKGLGLSANKSDKNSAMCVKCHQDTNAQFKMRSHHPVQEGGMSCTGCHDPHGGGNTVLKTRSEQCLSCHQSIRGPKVFEHAPVVDDCMSCHAPHGSPNRRLLSASQPAVCLQCHSVAQGKHGFGTGAEPGSISGTRIISGTVLRGCTNCHGAIHGSQQDPLLRY